MSAAAVGVKCVVWCGGHRAHVIGEPGGTERYRCAFVQRIVFLGEVVCDVFWFIGYVIITEKPMRVQMQ